MITNTFQDLTLSRLGFGAMRLPMMETDPSKIDEEQVFRMVDYALENGINYFDTAFPYHAGYSEIVLGKALARHPRESFYLATKYPGHQITVQGTPFPRRSSAALLPSVVPPNIRICPFSALICPAMPFRVPWRSREASPSCFRSALSTGSR